MYVVWRSSQSVSKQVGINRETTESKKKSVNVSENENDEVKKSEDGKKTVHVPSYLLLLSFSSSCFNLLPSSFTPSASLMSFVIYTPDIHIHKIHIVMFFSRFVIRACVWVCSSFSASSFFLMPEDILSISEKFTTHHQRRWSDGIIHISRQNIHAWCCWSFFCCAACPKMNYLIYIL